MTPNQIDRFCANLPAATRTVQWEGVIVLRVGGKMFCLIAPEDHSVGRISFKSAVRKSIGQEHRVCGS